MKEILIIGQTPPLEGGAQMHIYEVASRISSADIATQKGSVFKNYISFNILKSPTLIREVTFFLNALFLSIKILVFKREYKLVHLHQNLCYFIAPLLRLRYKVVITVHGIHGFKFYDCKFFWFFFRNALSFANGIIAVNSEDEKELKKYFGDKVVYIPNGVNLSIYSKINPPVEDKIGFIGRIHEQKGIIYLLEAFHEVEKVHPEFKLDIIGEVNDYAKQLQKKFPSKNIIWRGYLSDRKEIVKILKSSYCIALPSLWEGLPLTLFEALASSRPVIVSDIPAFKSVLKDEAIFYEVKNSKDLEKSIKLIIEDKSLAKAYGIKGKKLAEVYDWDNIAKKIQEIYSNAIKS